MHILDELKKIPSTPKDLRKFGWTLGIIFGLLGALLMWKGRPLGPYFGGAAVFFLFFGTILPVFLRPFQFVWMGLALMMGSITSRVILALLFVGIIIPIGVITRLSGIDFMSKKKKKNISSFWTVREPSNDNTRYERQS